MTIMLILLVKIIWRNMIISSIFYFSKSTSINTQYSGLWDTEGIVLFTKDHIKWKHIGRITWKNWFWFILTFSAELDAKRDKCLHCICSTATVLNITFNLLWQHSKHFSVLHDFLERFHPQRTPSHFVFTVWQLWNWDAFVPHTAVCVLSTVVTKYQLVFCPIGARVNC